MASSIVKNIGRKYGHEIPGLPALPAIKRPNPLTGSTKTKLGFTPLGTIAGEIAPSLKVIGLPQIQLFEIEGGGAEAVLSLTSKNLDYISQKDLEPLERYMRLVVLSAKAMSMGPLTLKILKKLGHPYGFDTLNRRPRKVPNSSPSGESLRHIKGAGIKGSVPTLSVINIQSGNLNEAWTFSVTKLNNKVECKLINDVYYAWFLAHGTHKMQSHGPWVAAFMQYLQDINNTWLSISRKASVKSKLDMVVDATGGI